MILVFVVDVDQFNVTPVRKCSLRRDIADYRKLFALHELSHASLVASDVLDIYFTQTQRCLGRRSFLIIFKH